MTRSVPPLPKDFDIYKAFGIAPDLPDPIQGMRDQLSKRPSTFKRFCDALADFIANIAEMPGTAIALIFIGQCSVVGCALVWAVLS